MNQKLHIVLANNIYPPIMAGGAELIVSYLAEGLAIQGHRVTVVSTCAPEMEPYPVETRNGVEVIRFFPKNIYWNFTRGNRPAYQKALWHLHDAWNRDAGKYFAAILSEKKPDILHTHLIDGMSAALWNAARQAGIPVIHTAHDYHLLCPSAILTKPESPAISLYRKWHLHTSRDIHLFCSPSQFLIEKHKEMGLTTKTAVVRNGIPLPAFDSSKKSPHKPRRFIFASRLTHEKGCEVLLNALRQIPAEVRFELVVAGKGPYEQAFAEAAANDARIQFVGYIQGDHKEILFRASDCLLIPSLWYENAPVVLAEASAYGMAVIGSDFGAIPEFVTHEKTGLLFDMGNAARLADAMQRVATDDALAQQLMHGSASAKTEYDVSRMVKDYLEQYQRLLAAQ